jgi:hypothetical protein
MIALAAPKKIIAGQSVTLMRKVHGIEDAESHHMQIS